MTEQEEFKKCSLDKLLLGIAVHAVKELKNRNEFKEPWRRPPGVMISPVTNANLGSPWGKTHPLHNRLKENIKLPVLKAWSAGKTNHDWLRQKEFDSQVIQPIASPVLVITRKNTGGEDSTSKQTGTVAVGHILASPGRLLMKMLKRQRMNYSSKGDGGDLAFRSPAVASKNEPTMVKGILSVNQLELKTTAHRGQSTIFHSLPIADGLSSYTTYSRVSTEMTRSSPSMISENSNTGWLHNGTILSHSKVTISKDFTTDEDELSQPTFSPITSTKVTLSSPVVINGNLKPTNWQHNGSAQLSSVSAISYNLPIVKEQSYATVSPMISTGVIISNPVVFNESLKSIDWLHRTTWFPSKSNHGKWLASAEGLFSQPTTSPTITNNVNGSSSAIAGNLELTSQPSNGTTLPPSSVGFYHDFTKDEVLSSQPMSSHMTSTKVTRNSPVVISENLKSTSQLHHKTALSPSNFHNLPIADELSSHGTLSPKVAISNPVVSDERLKFAGNRTTFSNIMRSTSLPTRNTPHPFTWTTLLLTSHDDDLAPKEMERELTTSSVHSRVIPLSFTLMGINYTDSLAIQSSGAYRKLEMEIKLMIVVNWELTKNATRLILVLIGAGYQEAFQK
nr:PREDICTED: uncharacterized protein LOC106706513 [Latimeria chalumnae]|eukprot:XP_014353076.1 PREDICTED: uncharacterized protein LOC106706513 [Latimeria chalumnae]